MDLAPGSKANDPGLANQNITLLTQLVDSGTSIQNQSHSVVGLFYQNCWKKGEKNIRVYGRGGWGTNLSLWCRYTINLSDSLPLMLLEGSLVHWSNLHSRL